MRNLGIEGLLETEAWDGGMMGDGVLEYWSVGFRDSGIQVLRNSGIEELLRTEGWNVERMEEENLEYWNTGRLE